MRQAHRGESILADRLEIPAAAFDIKDLFFLAEEVTFPDLNRRIAPAMQDQAGISSEKLRGINPLGQVGLVFTRFGRVPKILHVAWMD